MAELLCQAKAHLLYTPLATETKPLERANKQLCDNPALNTGQAVNLKDALQDLKLLGCDVTAVKCSVTTGNTYRTRKETYPDSTAL